MNTKGPAPLIPSHLHFIWYGKTLPDFAHVAIRSALVANPGAYATLWHNDEFESDAESRMMATIGLRLQKIDIAQLFSELTNAQTDVDVPRLRQIYDCLTQPAARANVVRMLVLFLYGGIYLDTDTLTVKSLLPLRSAGAFCGEERVLWPSGTSKVNPRPLALGEIRRACSLLPGGYKFHRRMESFYALAANNAVIGAAPRHGLLKLMLASASRLPKSQWTRRYRLGTHLLQDSLRNYRFSSLNLYDSVRVLPPEYFYPVGPEISMHYFRKYDDPAKVAAELLTENTYVIHWYASVANLSSKDYGHIRRSQDSDVYSYLCHRHVSEAQHTVHAPAPRRAVVAW